MAIEFNNTVYETDKEGYLTDFRLWTEDLAPLLAATDGITLTDDHWEVVRFVRNFYLEYKTSPAIRALIKAMKDEFGEDKANSRYLHRLFPKGAAKQATKIAGLPKPKRCL
ncbi:TusE/DsrC/DsvC family sulfur relay protein [Thalassotalea ponticola]|uniref:TusE/DsrC/DsvC family sulfur relay protein n=1 Tax=Thalassotalea ponticola TaxID=1523392 RepID=UPI0025B2E199|nr:TusE/DsrC/DsvC family sulfur relay protein [Thalassotalea ponticola]MDN3651459.1 TusE/DsrC/DsvC family sulfur relay protein [Thalassotalea ponticola]